MNQLSPSSITRLTFPSTCERRTWLRDVAKLDEAPDGPFAKFNKQQGLRHEARVLDELRGAHPDLVDLEGFENADAAAQTVELVAAGGPLIFQGKLQSEAMIGGEQQLIYGYPDFLIPEQGGWVIADAKLTRRIFDEGKDGSMKERPAKKAIFLQLRLYGWLFEQMFPGTAFSLRVYNGAGGIETVEYHGGDAPLAELARIVELRGLKAEPHEVVGWSKCGACGYKEHCWPAAEAEQALGLVIGIDTRLAPKLEAVGISSYAQLAEQLDAVALARIKSQKGDNIAGAQQILENVEALISGETVRRRDLDGNEVAVDPVVNQAANFVIFDLEGLPPELDEAEKVYLWGMQVFGEQQGEFIAALADFGEDGDRHGWEQFLARAAELLSEHPGIRFVHWANYEKKMLDRYIERYGDDKAGTAAAVLASLLDLLPITRAVVAIPEPSYSLKVVEKSAAVVALTGFSRSADDVTKGDDSIAAFIEAVETEDMTRRDEIVADICAYNQEDLEATWAVLRWLRVVGGE